MNQRGYGGSRADEPGTRPPEPPPDELQPDLLGVHAPRPGRQRLLQTRKDCSRKLCFSFVKNIVLPKHVNQMILDNGYWLDNDYYVC